MECIVFNREQLEALDEGITSVALCDNDFVIYPVRGREYRAIGKVSAVVKCSAMDAIAMGNVFIGFEPVFDDTPLKPKKAPIIPVVSSFASSFVSSFVSSFKTSFSTSFRTSFHSMHEYEYEYRVGSFKKGSFKGSFHGSFVIGSFRNIASFVLRRRRRVREIAVNGYGLNLI